MVKDSSAERVDDDHGFRGAPLEATCLVALTPTWTGRADRAWFVAPDVDADDMCITGHDHLIRAILADPVLAAVRAQRP